MGDILLLIYRSDQRSPKFQYLVMRVWGSAADAVFYCSLVSSTSLLPVSDLDPSHNYVEMQGQIGGLQSQPRGLPALLTDLQLQRSCFHFTCPFIPTGQVRYWTVTLSCHMWEVWGERSHCQHFSPSPLKGIKGTALDAVCTMGGKVCVSGFGCSHRTVYRIRPRMARTAVD